MNICKNCGGELGLHHCETDQCHVWGRQAPIDRNQEWKSTTFEVESDDAEYIAKLEKFVQKFLDNFVDCEYCKGKGQIKDTDCRICHGTGKHINSIGMLYVELPNEARELLKERS